MALQTTGGSNAGGVKQAMLGRTKWVEPQTGEPTSEFWSLVHSLWLRTGATSAPTSSTGGGGVGITALVNEVNAALQESASALELAELALMGGDGDTVGSGSTTGTSSITNGTELLALGADGLASVGDIFKLDNVPIGSVTPSSGAFTTLTVSYDLTTAGLSGQFIGSSLITTLGAVQTTASNFYIGGQTIFSSAFASPTGYGIGAISQAVLQTNATGWQELVASQAEISSQTGTSVVYKFGYKLVLTNDDVTAATGQNAAFVLNAQQGWAGHGWDTAFCVGSALGWWPLSAGATILGTSPPAGGGPAYAAAHGVDLSSVAFSSDAFKSTGFLVDGSGNTTVRELTSSNVFIDTSVFTTSPLTGGTVTVPSGAARVIVNPAGTLAALTIAAPANPSLVAGAVQVLEIIFTQQVTALTWTGWGTITGAQLPTFGVIGLCARLKWLQGTGWVHEANTAWADVGGSLIVPNGRSYGWLDTSGAQAFFELQTDDYLVLYSTDATGAPRAVLNILTHYSNSALNIVPPVTTANVHIDLSTVVSVPLTGGTVTVPSAIATQVINPAGALATLTVVAPGNPSNATNSAQKLKIIFTQAITTLTWTWTTTGAALPTTIAAGACVTLEWIQGIGWVHVLQA